MLGPRLSGGWRLSLRALIVFVGTHAVPTSRIRSSPLISLMRIRGRMILGALSPLVCRKWGISRRSFIYTMRFLTTARQIWSGEDISTFKDMVAGVPSISSESVLGPAVGGNPSSGGDKLRGVRTCAVSFRFTKGGGADLRRGCAAQFPMLRKKIQQLGMSTICKLTCRPRSVLPPQLQSAGLVLRELPLFDPQRHCNMCCLGATRGVSHFAPLGRVAFRAGTGARTSLQFGPKSTRRSRRARTGFPSPSPNIRAAHPS